MHLRVRLLTLVAFLILLWVNVEQFQNDPISTSTNTSIHLTAESTRSSVTLKWSDISAKGCQTVKIFRAKDSNNFQEIVFLKSDTTRVYEDKTTRSGYFSYQIICKSPQSIKVSNVARARVKINFKHHH